MHVVWIVDWFQINILTHLIPTTIPHWIGIVQHGGISKKFSTFHPPTTRITGWANPTEHPRRHDGAILIRSISLFSIYIHSVQLETILICLGCPPPNLSYFLSLFSHGVGRWFILSSDPVGWVSTLYNVYRSISRHQIWREGSIKP